LREKGKPHKVVLIAVARKLLIIANVLVAKKCGLGAKLNTVATGCRR
jgi:hypothetical protein